ncbi:fungal-specific transcription factor domain-containing protein [Xylariales sp. PMI_506]|nr:fungal-specific transcription factor domain-containing protein [Xylariales sp. PMI_506]
MPDRLVPNSIPVARPKRHKIDVACDMCRARKVKCDGIRPVCGNCLKRIDMKDHCNYSTGTVHREAEPVVSADSSIAPTSDRIHARVSALYTPSPRSRARDDLQDPNPLAQAAGSISGASPVSLVSPAQGISPAESRQRSQADVNASSIDSMTTVVEDGASTQQYFGSSSAGSFIRQINAAIDARLGVSSTRSLHNPAGSTPRMERATENAAESDQDYALPSRRQADQYMQVYWQYVDPLYPFLDKQRWNKQYNDFFVGGVVDMDERVFVTTLNIIFALSVQLIELWDHEKRDRFSNIYFRRAENLLRMDMWQPGSIERVQCLLLLSQHLQSMNNPHQTWMIVGSAIRTAQSLGLHLATTSANVTDPSERQLLRRLWHGCVLMDRMVAVTHGRPSMISKCLAVAVPLPDTSEKPRSNSTAEEPEEAMRVSFFVKSVELYEIINHIIYAFYSAHNSTSTSSSVLHLQDSAGSNLSSIDENDLGPLIKLDKSLSLWERSLPNHLIYERLEQTEDEIYKRQTVILYIRLLQARILLYRPTTSRFCLGEVYPSTGAFLDDLSSRLVQQCAMLGVATAQKVTSVLKRFERDDGSIGLLPAWWYRIYYVYSAATILIVAKLRPDVFPLEDVERAWGEAMSVLEAHERFGQSARRCGASLSILSARILHGTDATAFSGGVGMAVDNEHAGFGIPVQSINQNMYGELGAYPDLNLETLAFDANDLSYLDLHAWELLNQP